MLVRWKNMNLKVIPELGKNGAIISSIVLANGINEVDTQTWKKVRASVEDSIAAGDIEEIEVKVDLLPKAKATDKDKWGIISCAEFKELDLKTAIQMVKECGNPATLEKWKEDESRDSVRAAIMNRQDTIKNYNPKK